MQIVQRGNEHTNSSSREGYVPIGICDHISGGSMSSMRSWFTSAGNDVSSAHFGVSKTGEIDQYVDIRRMAWTQGITAASLPKVTAQIVKDKCARGFINPNKFLVGIEHEGTDGQLTEAQLAASVWLHKFIADEVARIWGESARFPLNSYTVVGHFQIDPVRKPYCPGPKFPWQALYSAFKEDEPMTAAERAELEALKTSNATILKTLNAQTEKIKDLENTRDIPAPEWAKEAAAYYGPYMSPKTGSVDFWRAITIQYRKEKGLKV
ncbi:N-acetylmuramoyl-L-alanine amidase [Paenibacillus sp. MMO-177]|uniref:N-acetylmuramoyl-L-alanine amidase n=1 Tax=Paenibacillus sp. MMO-177 TaxID=3081289 RepID=UPI003016E998